MIYQRKLPEEAVAAAKAAEAGLVTVHQDRRRNPVNFLFYFEECKSVLLHSFYQNLSKTIFHRTLAPGAASARENAEKRREIISSEALRSFADSAVILLAKLKESASLFLPAAAIPPSVLGLSHSCGQ